MTTLVFVYGSLKKRFQNHDRFLSQSTFVGLGITKPDYEMYSCRVYPALQRARQPGKGTSIKGEIYEVDQETLKALDLFERVPLFYVRETISLMKPEFINKEYEIIVQIYISTADLSYLPKVGNEWTLNHVY